MSNRTLSVVPAALLLLAVAGCAPGGSGDAGGGGTGGGDAGGGDTGGGDTSALNCDDADLSGGWELFIDDALTVDPAGTGPTSLQTAADSIHFEYAATEEYTTYGYQLGYIDDEGTVFPNDSGIAFPDGHPDAPDDNVFTITGPFAPSGIDGGPYAGVLQIDATDSAGTRIIASICVILAVDD
jgi:hypothetical protein